MTSARDEFLEASFWHGGLDKPKAILEAHPALAGSDIFVAATLGDDVAVQEFLRTDKSLATVKGGPRDAVPLVYLCFSRFLAHDASRSDAFMRTATALLDAGADANSGFVEVYDGKPVWETAIYGAAGVAHHEGLTRLLLERGADPNDDETPYHSPEEWDDGAFRVLVESGKMNADSVAVMLLRKSDWHHYDGVKLVLDRCRVDINRMSRFGRTILHHAILSDNDLAIIELLLDSGADARIVAENLNHGGPKREGRSSISLAARRGRGDVLDALEKRGIALDLDPVDRAIAACARGRGDEARRADSATREKMRAEAGMLLVEFAGNDNDAGVACLLDLGLPVDAPYVHSEGYFDITPKTTALHNAAWRGSHDTVELLVRRGANVHARDSKDRTPLVQAIRAATESYWRERRNTRSIKALLDAGATSAGVKLPTGYDEADALLAAPR